MEAVGLCCKVIFLHDFKRIFFRVEANMDSDKY